MGHSSIAILDMYFTMNDRHAQAAMNSLSFDSEQGQSRTVVGQSGGHSEQTLPQVSHV
jgi:ABC-type dipeptide/oligopeptide/nickel transport system ATPase subunit